MKSPAAGSSSNPPEAFAERLQDELERARALGFLGPGPVSAHIGHAAAFAQAVATVPLRVVDLGSGGGVPGLVLAGVWERAEFVLLDASERRTAFLRQAVERLGLGHRVSVVRARAETAAREQRWRRWASTVVARSFGSPATTAECAAPFLMVGGQLVVSEPPDGGAERWPKDALGQLGLRYEQEGCSGAARVSVLRQAVACPDRFPRRIGLPAKRPLF